MIARVIRGGGFRGCLRYILRRRTKDKGKYTPVMPGPGGGAITCPVMAPVTIIVIRTTWRGAYIGTVLDRGNKLTASGYPTDKSAAWHLAAQAAKKGWARVVASGSDEFLRWNYDYLLARGIGIKTKDDHQAAILAAVKADRLAAGKDTWAKILPEPNTPPPPKPLEPKIIGGNMIGQTVKELCREFAVGRRQRPGCKKPVWHSPVSLAPGEHLSQEQWAALAAEYVKKMGFGPNHDYVVVQHNDREYEHIHIVVNRISTDGQLWAGRWEAHRAHKITNELAKKYGLQQVEIKKPKRKAPGMKELSKMERTGQAPDRMQLQTLIDTALAGQPTTAAFLERLENAGVVAKPNIATTGRMNGFSFGLAGSNLFFSGSKLGKKYTWKRIKEVIDYEQDRDGKILGAARDRATTGTNPAHHGGPGVGGHDPQNTDNQRRNNQRNQPDQNRDKRDLQRSDCGGKGGKKNTGSGGRNQQDAYHHPRASTGQNSAKDMDGNNIKRPDRRLNRGTVAPVVRRWPFDGPLAVMDGWWKAYQSALTTGDTGRAERQRVQAEQVQRLLAKGGDIYPHFGDEPATYYIRAAVELLSRPEAAKLTATEVDAVIAEIMSRRDRPDEQIQAVLEQSPITGDGANAIITAVLDEIVQQLAPAKDDNDDSYRPDAD